MIPSVVHWLWFGSPVPDGYRAQTERFGELNPTVVHEWWDEDRVRDLDMTNRYWFDHASDVVPEDSRYQFMSDIARYEILYQFGGIYLDLDYLWQQPLTPWLRGEQLVSCWELQYRYVANGFIAAEAEHEALDLAIRSVPGRISTRHRSWRANRITGPHLWTPIAKRHATILAQRLMHPVPWSHPEWVDQRDYPNAIAIHAWGHQRTLRGMNRGESR